jgi:hypothetical protein
MTMAARKPVRDADPPPLSVRLSAEAIKALDAWLAEQNRGRTTPLTRTDLLRGVLTWAARTKPQWDEGQHVLIVVDEEGRTLLRQPTRHVTSAEITFEEDGRQRRATFAETKVEGGQVVTVFRAVPLHGPRAGRG